MQQTTADTRANLVKATMELLFSGGRGGKVTYDGRGGPMEKEGGPIDRLYVFNKQALQEDALEIENGQINFRTGKLTGPVQTTTDTEGDTNVVFRFGEERDPKAVILTGGIPTLHIPEGTVLFRGDVEPSEMRWDLGDVSREPASLPYTARHTNVFLHPAICKRFGVKEPTAALTAWQKPTPSDMVFDKNATHGAAFTTEQHVASLRLFAATN
jgi:hypothetical protein